MGAAPGTAGNGTLAHPTPQFAVLEVGEPPPRGQWENPRRCPCASLLWTPGAIACPTRPRSRISASPIAVLPHPLGQPQPGTQGAARQGRSQASDLWVSQTCLHQPTPRVVPKEQRSSTRTQMGMGTCSACPRLLLRVHEPGRTYALPPTHPPEGPAVGCVDSSHGPTLSIWVTRVPRG